MDQNNKKARVNNFIRTKREFIAFLFVAAVVLLVPLSAHSPSGAEKDMEAQDQDLFTEDLLRIFKYRNIAPFRMSARA